MNKNCHNSRTSDDIEMKLWPVNKINKKKKPESKTFEYNIIPENCDIIVIFPIYDQFGATHKPDSVRIVCKTYCNWTGTQNHLVLKRTKWF